MNEPYTIQFPSIAINRDDDVIKLCQEIMKHKIVKLDLSEANRIGISCAVILAKCLRDHPDITIIAQHAIHNTLAYAIDIISEL